MPKYMVTFFLIGFTFCGSSLWGSTIVFTPELKSAFNLILDLKFEEATSKVETAESIDPDNLACVYVRGILTSVKLLLSENRKEFETKVEIIESVIQSLSKASEKDPQKRRMMAEMHLALAILHGKYQNNVRAGLQFYKAYNLLTSNYKLFPTYTPTLVPLGVLNAAIGSLPEGYQSMVSVFGISGSVEKGMRLLRKGYWRSISNKNHRFYQRYFAFIYSYTALKIEGTTDVSLESLGLKYSNSSCLIFLQSLIEVEKGNARKAMNLLVNRPKGPSYHDYLYLEYYTGKVAIAFSPDTARIYFNSFLKNNSDKNYRKSTYRYLSWCAMLQDKPEEFAKYRKWVLEKGNEETGADRQALREAQKPFNEVLIRGRILFDGGRYSDAIEYLNNSRNILPELTKEHQLEFHYRFGRVYQESANFPLAIKEFKEAIDLKLEPSTFALGNSALQLGKIYEVLGDKETAKKYFKLTLEFADFPFYEGVHQQAKAGLDRLK